jgi:hypothetical protein
MTNHINNWVIANKLSNLNNEKLDKLLINACTLSEPGITFLLNTTTQISIIEKIIYEIVDFHLKRLNIIFDENIFVEFWFKPYKNNNNNFHLDCDEYDRVINKSDNYDTPFLSCITYLNDNDVIPTVITDVDKEMFKYKIFTDVNSLYISLPRKTKHISFNGGKYYHSDSKLCVINEDIDRNILAINVWNTKPLNVPYFNYEYFLYKYVMYYKCPIDNFVFNQENILTINNDDNSTVKIKINDKVNDKNILSSDFFEELLYSNTSNCYQFQELINIYNRDNLYTTFLFEKEKTENANCDDCDKTININRTKVNVSNIPKFNQRSVLKNTYNKDICKWIINESEEYATNNSGWFKKRHAQYPTTDIPAELIKNVFKFVLISFQETLIKEIIKCYSIDETIYEFEIIDLFIVKYEKFEQNQTKLDLHDDHSCITVNILLNDPDEFKGGGTFFEDGITYHLNQGDAIIHSSKSKHAGIEITEGKRYVLVFFIDIYETS